MTKTIIVLTAVFLFWQSNSLAAGLNLTGGECDARSIDIRSYADERLGDDSLVFKTNKGNVTVPPSKVNNRCFSTTPAGYIKLNDYCTNKGTLVTGKKIESSNLSGCKERLRDYHRSCNSIDRGRSNSCVVAAHRYCRKNILGDSGYIVEATREKYGLICTSGMHLEGTKSNHSSCIGNPTTNSAQNASCLGKAAKYCSDKGCKGGFFTEIGDEIHVSCFKRSVAQPEFVDVADLKTYHDRCSDISDLNCFAAVNRYCNDIHGKSGIPQIAASSSRFKILCLSNARGRGVEP